MLFKKNKTKTSSSKTEMNFILFFNKKKVKRNTQYKSVNVCISGSDESDNI